jgi:hypothetical protein
LVVEPFNTAFYSLATGQGRKGSMIPSIESESSSTLTTALVSLSDTPVEDDYNSPQRRTSTPHKGTIMA